LTVVLVLIIVLAWIAFLGPTILRARNRQGRADSVGDFRHRLTQLGHTNGRHRDHQSRTPYASYQRPMFAPSTARPMSPVQRRRRDVLLVLAGLAAVTFVAAIALRSAPAFLLNLLADAALVAYAYMLVQIKQRVSERRVKVRFLGGAERARPTYFLEDVDDRVGRAPGAPRLVPLRQTASR
jgi:hypothetical protein